MESIPILQGLNNPSEEQLTHGVVHTVQEVAEQLLHLKPKRAKGKIEWHGANPKGGATTDGFILFAEGNAIDRKTDETFTSAQVAELAGITSGQYEPCVSFAATNGRGSTPAPVKSARTPKTAPNGAPKKPKVEVVKSISFDYQDGEGALLFRVTRKELADGSKTFVASRPNPSARSGVSFDLGDVEPVLYRLPQVRRASKVFVVEGEKCADALNAAFEAEEFTSLVATTSPFGAGKGWLAPYSEELTGKDVCVLPDNDAPGARYAATVCAATHGKAERLRLLELPNLPEKGDVVDFLASGGTVEQLFDLLEVAPVWTPEMAPEPPVQEEQPQEAKRPRFALRPLADIENQPQRPAFIEGVAPLGGLFGLVGPYGCGKSFLAIEWALCAATGRDWQGHKVSGGAVVYITPEGTEAFGKRTKAWRIARGGEGAPVECPANFHLVTEAPLLMYPGDVDELLQALQGLPEPPVLVVIDTVARHMVGGDENGQRDAGLFVAGADKIREATGATVLLVHHTGKDGTMRGSTAIPGAMDAIVTMQKAGEKRATLTNSKAKDMAPFEPIGLVAHVVELPELDATGRPLTSLVFNLDTTGPNLPEARPKENLTDKTRAQVLEILATQFPKGTTGKEWQEAVEKAGIARKSNFYNCRDALLTSGAVRTANRLYVAMNNGASD